MARRKRAVAATARGSRSGPRIRLLDWLTFTGDFTYTAKAEFVDTGFAIPLAPLWTARADLTARLPWGLSSSLEMRYLGDRWADEFRYQTARGYTLFNSTTRYRFRNFEAFLTIENLNMGLELMYEVVRRVCA